MSPEEHILIMALALGFPNREVLTRASSGSGFVEGVCPGTP